MATPKSIQSFLARFKNSSTKNKVLVTVFIIGFAGIGVYGVVNSSAATPPLAIQYFTFNPKTVTVGQPVTYYWASSNATGCRLAPSGAPGSGAISTSGTLQAIATTAGTFNMDLWCYGKGSIDTGAGTLTVNPAPPPPAGDTTPPTAPSGLKGAAIGGGKITLNWIGATDNVKVTSYKVKLANRGNVATVTAPGYTTTLNRATAGRSYTYTVLAIDAAGNTSPASNSVTVVAK